MTGHGFTQFKLTQNLLNNLSQFEITPTAKLVLLYLSSCYNPKKTDMFPKQKTIALKIGISERSVVRAICELIKAGLIIAECKYTNRYKFTSKIAEKLRIGEKFFAPDNLSENECQNDVLEDDKLSLHKHEPTSEPINKPASVEEYKLLKQYALEHKARNINAYVNWLKSSGKAKEIIAANRIITQRYQTGELKRLAAMQQESYESVSSGYFAKVREELSKL